MHDTSQKVEVVTSKILPGLAWCGGHARLIIMGDVLDRGEKPYSIFVAIAELMYLASLQGGEVIFVIGNHEFHRISGAHKYAYFGEFSDREVWYEYQRIVGIRSPDLEEADAEQERSTKAYVNWVRLWRLIPYLYKESVLFLSGK